MKTILLNGKTFEMGKTLPLEDAPTKKTKTIYDAYQRPSAKKRTIWLDWENWFKDNHGSCWVYGASCHFFSICGIVRDINTNKVYSCYITPKHNFCYEILI